MVRISNTSLRQKGPLPSCCLRVCCFTWVKPCQPSVCIINTIVTTTHFCSFLKKKSRALTLWINHPREEQWWYWRANLYMQEQINGDHGPIAVINSFIWSHFIINRYWGKRQCHCTVDITNSIPLSTTSIPHSDISSSISQCNQHYPLCIRY